MSGISAMVDLIHSVVDSMHTSMPAVVESYDAKAGTVSVTPTQNIRMRNGIAVKLPLLRGVPVMFPQTSMFDIRFPVKKGDKVLLVFTESDLSLWKSSDGSRVTTPRTYSRGSLGNAVAIVGLSPKPVEGKCRMILHDDGTLEFSARKVDFACPVVMEKNLIVRKDVFVGSTDAMGISVLNHVHTTAVGPSTPGQQLPNTEPEAVIPPLEAQ